MTDYDLMTSGFFAVCADSPAGIQIGRRPAPMTRPKPLSRSSLTARRVLKRKNPFGADSPEPNHDGVLKFIEGVTNQHVNPHAEAMAPWDSYE